MDEELYVCYAQRTSKLLSRRLNSWLIFLDPAGYQQSLCLYEFPYKYFKTLLQTLIFVAVLVESTIFSANFPYGVYFKSSQYVLNTSRRIIVTAIAIDCVPVYLSTFVIYASFVQLCQPENYKIVITLFCIFLW